jgi:hypothetical protein
VSWTASVRTIRSWPVWPTTWGTGTSRC